MTRQLDDAIISMISDAILEAFPGCYGLTKVTGDFNNLYVYALGVTKPYHLGEIQARAMLQYMYRTGVENIDKTEIEIITDLVKNSVCKSYAMNKIKSLESIGKSIKATGDIDNHRKKLTIQKLRKMSQ